MAQCRHFRSRFKLSFGARLLYDAVGLEVVSSSWDNDGGGGEGAGVGNALDSAPSVDGISMGIGVWRVKGRTPVRREL